MMKKVLIVEDEVTILELLSTILSDCKQYIILRATDGKEAISIARKEKPDLILLDLLLPRMNGYQVCESLRSDPETACTKVIMITGMTQRSDRLMGEKVGVDAYITKPFNSGSLVEKVKELLTV